MIPSLCGNVSPLLESLFFFPNEPFMQLLKEKVILFILFLSCILAPFCAWLNVVKSLK